MAQRQGLIHYYYGDGKGKTTAAFGLAARALGHGMRVVAVQFLKSSPSGEVIFFEGMDSMTILLGQACGKFSFQMNEEERRETARLHDANLRAALELIDSGRCDVLLLDEVSDAVELGLMDSNALFAFLKHKPTALEVVMTGHKGLPEFLSIADYATQMRNEKHPFDRGVTARRGIEM